MVIIAKQFNFSFIIPQGVSPKFKVFVSVCIYKLSFGFFNVAFGVTASSWLTGLLIHVSKGLVSLWVMTLSYQLQQHLHKVFSFSSGADMNILHQSAFISGTQSPSPS